ncbi:MAG: thiamine biosynthesis lipoprotein [Ulvibacter sp.]|jgi:thiamine biosynthesis lipoprotein
MRLIYFISAIVLLISCEEKGTQLEVLQGDAFGTTFTIQYLPSAARDANSENTAIAKGVDSVIQAVNKSVSTYMPKSDISKINGGDKTVVVDAIFEEVFRISETVYTNSRGYFDPTIGVLRNAYGFGDVKPIKTINTHVLDSLMQFVGFNKVAISGDGTVMKERPEIYFDFNAVAKGYGIDCIGVYLESQGVSNYLIELGGEILAKGTNSAKGKLWVVGIENVDSSLENREYATTIKLQDKGLASSGNYRKFRIDSLSGKKYVHTLNPLTGSAEQSDVTSATVVASSCGVADAYATAFMALGLEKSKDLLKVTAGIEAYLTYNDSFNVQQVFKTEGFTKLLIN